MTKKYFCISTGKHACKSGSAEFTLSGLGAFFGLALSSMVLSSYKPIKTNSRKKAKTHRSGAHCGRHHWFPWSPRRCSGGVEDSLEFGEFIILGRDLAVRLALVLGDLALRLQLQLALMILHLALALHFNTTFLSVCLLQFCRF